MQPQERGGGGLELERRGLLDQLAHALRREGFTDPAALEALARVPREEFVPQEMRDEAYRNAPAEIGYEQTISQPLIVALMAEHLQLRPTDRVLEIGTGSGYGAAVLSELAGDVYTVERFEPLAVAAAERLARLGYDNVHVRYGDGRLGWPEASPFDAVVATAACDEIPPALVEQLRIGGRLVMPLGGSLAGQSLVLLEKTGLNETRSVDLGSVRFVPLLPGTVGAAAE